MLDFDDSGSGARLTVGRTKDNDIIVDDPSVSRFHAALALNRQGDVIVSDLASANGTYINGRRINSSEVLNQGDELTLGSVPFTLGLG
jgi:ABC transport system ATP-binding/permease protein